MAPPVRGEREQRRGKSGPANGLRNFPGAAERIKNGEERLHRAARLSLPSSRLPIRIAAVGLGLLAGCTTEDVSQPIPATKVPYAEVVRTFMTGTVALQVGDNARARQELSRASELAPGEPAIWANLALVSLKTQDYAGARRAAEKALALAPRRSVVYLLKAQIEVHGGNPDAAFQALETGLKLDPQDVQVRFARIEQLQRRAGLSEEPDTRPEWEAILRALPGNRYALLELLRAAAKAGDANRFRTGWAELKPRIHAWPPVAREWVGAVEKGIGGDVKPLWSAVTRVANTLRDHPEVQKDYIALKGPDEFRVRPFTTFLRLPGVIPGAAPPDTNLQFVSRPVPAGLPARVPWLRAEFLRPSPPPDARVAHDSTGGGVPTPAPSEGKAAALPPESPALLAITGSSLVASAPHLGTLALPVTPESATGCRLADWNYDFLPDLAVAGAKGLRLFVQQSAGKWKDITASTGLPPAVTAGAWTGVWLVDIELDGDLDLILGTKQGAPVGVRNNADGTWAVLRPFPALNGMTTFIWADFDGDGDPDGAALDGAGHPVLLLNGRLGVYQIVPLPGGVKQATALVAADANRDGTLDLVLLEPTGSVRVVRQSGDGAGWQAEDLVTGAGQGGAGLFWADFDNNGALDLLVSGAQESRIWLADGAGKLTAPAAPLALRVDAVGDLDQDGRLDVAGVAPGGNAVVLKNQGTSAYGWIALRPRGLQTVKDNKSKINSFALGGEAEIRAGLVVEKQPITGPWLHFGLGAAQTAEYARVLWPNGQPQGEFTLDAGQGPVALQRLTGSCPWLFAHNGRTMEFVTDILWKSPLGLRINAQATAGVSQTLDWVRVRGDQLAVRDGHYDLSVTAELWETDFFDTVALMTVDHPAGTELLLDERFSIPQPPHQLHLMRAALPVARATDERGQDQTETVRTEDERYVDSFPLGMFQGVAQDHFLEIELPATAPRTGPLWLAASGWVFPTDSSLNVALSQGRHAPPRSLSLEAPAPGGGWTTVRSGLGFPAGKKKTVLLDLADLYRPGAIAAAWDPQAKGSAPRRLRLRTNLEIYWDAVKVVSPAVGARPRTQVLAPTVADLRYRGYSRVRQASRRAPELPEYGVVAQSGQQWLDQVGFFTRFGDVRELLARVEDRYVIMNAGDELRLRFAAPPPPPAGWVRDFVFVSDGWDKDGNLNTTHSRTVLPLPSHADAEYRSPLRPLDQDPVYRRFPADWQNYHTRYVTPESFRNALR